MRRRTPWLALAIGVALAQRARAESAFEATLLGANEVPGPGMSEGSFEAVVRVEGTKVRLTLTPKGARGPVAVHIHRGAAGVGGRLVAEFPWTSGDASPRTAVAPISERASADLIANPGKYYVDVHTRDFPTGAARGQLAVRAPGAGRDTQAAEAPTADGPPSGALPAAAAQSEPAQPMEPAGPLPPRFEPRGEGSAPERTGKASQKIVGSAPPIKTYLDPDFRLDVSATSGLEIVFVAWGDCTVDGPYVHILRAGSCTLEAHQPGDENYLAARIVDLQFPIARASQTIDFPDFPDPLHERHLTLQARASSGLPVTFGAGGSCSLRGSSLRLDGPGECVVSASQPGNANFIAAPTVTRTLSFVEPAPRN